MARSFFEVLTAAVNDFAAHGYDNSERLEYWLSEIQKAAKESLTPPHEMEEMLQHSLRAIYQKLVERGGIFDRHPGISRFTLEKVKPQLRAELNRRIVASADLIQRNREQAIAKTLQRFAGWSTSIPAGGSEAVPKRDTKTEIRKSLAGLPFDERRVLIDQGHKFTAALSETLATGSGAIAGIWRSHYRQAGYHYRPDHKERDGKVYTLRGNWALERGLMKVGPAGHYDDITHAGEEVFCRCWMIWIYAIRSLPDDMVTEKGRAEMERVRVA